MSPLPCHLIAGPPGVGKTTAIRRLVAAAGENIGVIVNDFGATGYDASFIAETGAAGRLRVENVPGGCLCCTSAAQLQPALAAMCARPDITRIIVEPSGIALLDPLLAMLRRTAAACGFEVAPVIVLFDPRRIRPQMLEAIPYWRHLADRADIAVLNRCDTAPPQAVEDLARALEGRSPPPMRVIATTQGALPADILSLRGGAPPPDGAPRLHMHLPAKGMLRADGVFDAAAVRRLLEGARGELERFKGVLLTDRGWRRMEVASGCVEEAPAREQAISSAEWIGRGADFAQVMEGARLSGPVR